MTCDSCRAELSIGDWPYCPHGKPNGMLGQFRERYDDHIAPPPSERFCPKGAPEYVEGKGYKLTSLADKKRLLRLNGAYERG